MTNPNPDTGWNLQDLPVLTEVVDNDAIPVLDVPAYDFSAELDAMADALPEDNVPELALPPELSLDDVLGDEAERRDALDASAMIGRLPSLDLEVDLPAELSLDDVLPGLDYRPPAANGDDFAFELDDAPDAAPAPPVTAGEQGLGALFARANFAPLDPAPVSNDTLQADQVSLDQFSAQLDDFADSVDMPELPQDAFLSKADAQAAPAPQLITADAGDDVWADSWEPPPAAVAPPEAPVPAAPDPASFAVSVDDILAGLQPRVVATAPAAAFAETPATVAEPAPWQHAALDVPELQDSLPPTLDSWSAQSSPVVPEPAAPVASPAAAFAETPATVAEPAPWQHVALDVPELQDSLPPTLDSWSAQGSPVVPEPAAPVASPAAVFAETPATVAEPAPWQHAALDVPELQDSLPPTLDSWSAPASPVVPEPAAPVPSQAAAFAETPATVAAPAPWQHAALDVSELQDSLPPTPDSWSAPASPVVPEPAVVEPSPAPAVPPLQSISLDSLPTGVLGGGLGLATAAPSPAASLGEPAASLPGGNWSPATPAFHAGDKEVELAWARDLGAEPPLDLDELPQASEVAAAVAAPVLADVMRLRRSMPAPAAELPPAPAANPAVEVPVAVLPVLDEVIHVAAVGAALPRPATPAPVLASGGVSEEALIEALYARVLPRMKVELTLWMQDALEQQAKLLMAGVMQQLKEDFDMMLAESLRASLREALDEAKAGTDKDKT